MRAPWGPELRPENALIRGGGKKQALLRKSMTRRTMWQDIKWFSMKQGHERIDQ